MNVIQQRGYYPRGGLDKNAFLEGFKRFLLEPRDVVKGRGGLGLSRRTARDYAAKARRLLEECFNPAEPEQSLERCAELIKKRYRNTNSQAVPLRALKALLKYVGREDLALQVRIPPAARRRTAAPSAEAIARLLEEAEGRLRAFALVMLTGGPRPAALWRLRWEWLRFEPWGGYAEYPEEARKGTKPVAVVFFSRAAAEELRQVDASRPFTEAPVRRAWRQLTSRLGLNLVPYDLRAYFINRAYELLGTQYRELIKFLVGEGGSDTMDKHYMYYKQLALKVYPRIAPKILEPLGVKT